MLRVLNLFPTGHLLMLSLALNASFILRYVWHWHQTVTETETFLAGDSPTDRQVTSVLDNRDRIINLDHGDPVVYERYWQNIGDESSIVISGWQSISYFSDTENLCWFLEPKLGKEIIRMHEIVGNAVTKDSHIVVGTGSTQLFQAVLYALSAPGSSRPMDVVSEAPYYSSYPSITECLESRLYRWVGDARSFDGEGPFIELVTSPNNPDGRPRQPMVNKTGGTLVHDLAYYWPQYTPISSPANHSLMLFTLSKSTGHAGMRIGWALVKDYEVAKKMTKFIELNTIGVSKDSQLRAAKVLKSVSDGCENSGKKTSQECLFGFAYHVMAQRWKLLKEALQQNHLFALPHFSPGFCEFLGISFEPQPAFLWLLCKETVDDCEDFLRQSGIIARSGKKFGVGPQYVRISMLDRDENMKLFFERLSAITLS